MDFFLNKYLGHNVLLLQGPMGPFFKRLSHDLTQNGAKVHKINLNGGDFFFYNTKSANFTEHLSEWPSFLSDYLDDFKIDKIILFGDCRIYHIQAIAIAKLKKIDVCVFEEGYYRPDYITFEKYGVSNNSVIPRDSESYIKFTEDRNPVSPHKVGGAFLYMAFYAFLYYLLCSLLWPFFSNYRHHRNLKPNEIFYWIVSLYRKCKYYFLERGFMKKVVEINSGDLFIVPLQVNVDSQILFHSRFTSTKGFISHVMFSFKNYAPQQTKLVFKHHPLDRGYHNYSVFISKLVKELGLGGRIFYVFEQELSTLYNHAMGVVVNNSTSGLAAIDKMLPTKVCGKAIYSIDGICYKHSINKFWKEAQNFKIDQLLYGRYKKYLIQYTQVNGNFYKRIKVSPYKSGLYF